jgi:hypothetical protein
MDPMDEPRVAAKRSDLPLYANDTKERRLMGIYGWERRQILRALLGITLALWLMLFHVPWRYHPSLWSPRHEDFSQNPAHLIEARHGAVAAENKRCSDIGVDVLKEGGNAIDAAIAATFCTGVVNMFS